MTTIFFKNISYKTGELEIRKFFSNFGTIKSFKLFKNERYNSKGCGIVEYETKEDMNKAIQSNGKKLGNRLVQIVFKNE